jgi:hypothetical protein
MWTMYVSNRISEIQWDRNGLNRVAILAIHHERLDSVNVKVIAKDFVEKNDYRLKVFGHFTC